VRQAESDFHKMGAGKFWWLEVINFQALNPGAAPILSVVEIP
jgi:hypothetical protein